MIHLRPGLLNGLFSSGFPTKILCAFAIASMRRTCSSNLILFDLCTLKYFMPITSAARTTLTLTACILGSWIRIQLKTWICVLLLLCCAVLCRYRPWDGPTPLPRVLPTVEKTVSKPSISRRPRFSKKYRATGKGNGKLICGEEYKLQNSTLRHVPLFIHPLTTATLPNIVVEWSA
jgi:hypothetical protein